jgi:hypothetical protein
MSRANDCRSTLLDIDTPLDRHRTRTCSRRIRIDSVKLPNRPPQTHKDYGLIVHRTVVYPRRRDVRSNRLDHSLLQHNTTQQIGSNFIDAQLDLCSRQACEDVWHIEASTSSAHQDCKCHWTSRATLVPLDCSARNRQNHVRIRLCIVESQCSHCRDPSLTIRRS